MSKSGSDYSESTESPDKRDDPTGSVSLQNESDLDRGAEERSSAVARKRHGTVLNSLREAIESDVSVTPPPKRPRNDSANEAFGLNKHFAAKELENLDSVRLALDGFPVERSQNFMKCGTLSVHAPSDVFGKQPKQQPLPLLRTVWIPFRQLCKMRKSTSFERSFSTGRLV